jgi:hypothetical protein
MRLIAQERRLRVAVKHGWSRLVSAARPRYRIAAQARERHFPVIATSASGAMPPAGVSADLVALTILAVNRLGPATLRTVAHGKPLTVRVPDARIGDIFRAALAEMQKTRLTDRLIAIVVDDAADAKPSPSPA